ncbi:MAG: malate dehydrogenase, partial [Frankiales bacterium]|nr:malate dehydrogenase [Frankiales bacterium]
MEPFWASPSRLSLREDRLSSRDADPVFALHRDGKIGVELTVPLETRDDLSMAYTPGVAKVCTAIAEEPDLVYDYTWKSRTVAVITDGTAVLGLGDIGAAASLPVMEGKAMLFKHFGGVDAVPICLDVTDTDQLVDTIVSLAPAFGGFNLEDISAPRCFEIERRVQDRVDIPVMHDDQHGTAIVVL